MLLLRQILMLPLFRRHFRHALLIFRCCRLFSRQFSPLIFDAFAIYAPRSAPG